MKKCPECGYDLPEDIVYCLYCGTKTSVSKLIKYNRKVFFLTPIFLLLISLGITYDLGSSNFLDYGIGTSGILISIYFFGALLFGAFIIFFRVKPAPDSFFKASITAVINAIITLFAVFAIENLYLEDFYYQSGPTNIIKNHFMLLSFVFAVVQLVETIAISAKAKVFNNPQLFKNITKNRIYSHFYLWFIFIFMVITAIGVYYTKMSDKTALVSELLIRISAKDRAKACLDNGIKKYPDSAKLYYLKSCLLTEGDDQLLTTLSPEIETEALNLAEKASTLKPESPLYKYYLSVQHDINRNYELSIRMASEAASIAKDDMYLWEYLGNLNLKKTNYKDSIIAYKKALEINPNNPTILNNLAYVLLINNQDLLIAMELAEKAFALMPNSVSLIDTLAWAYYKNERFPEALETINRLYDEKNEMMPEIDFHRAAILNEMDLLNNPIETYDKMIVKPEVAMNKSLVLQITEARKRAEEKMKIK